MSEESKYKDAFSGHMDDLCFHHTPWESELLARFSKPLTTVRIACPFIKLRNIRLILASLPIPISQRTVVSIVTRLNKRDCRAHVHDLSAIALLMRNPIPERCDIKIRINNLLHAKCFIFNNEEVIITSSNLSFAGFHRNIEMALATKRPDIISSAISYFDYVFTNARPITKDLLESVKTKVFATPLSFEEILPDESSEATRLADTPSDEQLYESNLDPTSIESIQGVLAEELDNDFTKLNVSLTPSLADEITGLQEQCAKEFFRDKAQRFAVLFGQPIPNQEQLAAIFAHKSVYMHLKDLKVDAEYADELNMIGSIALRAIVAEILIRSSKTSLSIGDLTVKVNYICASNHLEQQLTNLGISSALVDETSIGYERQRARNKILKDLAYRLVGFLVSGLSWVECVKTLTKILNLGESFPFESYRTFEYKTELQRCLQAANRTLPEYTIVSEEGADHNKSFIVEVKAGKRVLGRGTGPTKKLAEWKAAHEALKKVRNEEIEKRQKYIELIPEHLDRRCKSFGSDIIKKMTGRKLSESATCAILLPSGSPRCEYADAREMLAVLGGDVRPLVACQAYIGYKASIGEIVRWISEINSNNAIVERVSKTPLQEWIESVANVTAFRMAKDKHVVVRTVNACFGALILDGGLEACQSFGKILFGDKPDILKKKAKAQLLDIIQQTLRIQVKDVLEFKLEALHKPNEAYKALFRSKVIFCGQELSFGDATTKRSADEIACQKIIDNPSFFEELLRKEVARRKKEGILKDDNQEQDDKQ